MQLTWATHCARLLPPRCIQARRAEHKLGFRPRLVNVEWIQPARLLPARGQCTVSRGLTLCSDFLLHFCSSPLLALLLLVLTSGVSSASYPSPWQMKGQGQDPGKKWLICPSSSLPVESVPFILPLQGQMGLRQVTGSPRCFWHPVLYLSV